MAIPWFCTGARNGLSLIVSAGVRELELPTSWV